MRGSAIGGRSPAVLVVVVGFLVVACGGGGPSGPAPFAGTAPPPTTPEQPATPATPPVATPTPPSTSPETPPQAPPPPPAVDDCAGLLPASLGEPVEHRIPLHDWFCREPITDGTGEWIGLGTGYKQAGYWFVDAATGAGDTSVSTFAFQVAMMTPDGRVPPIAPQPHGYHVNRNGDSLPGTFQRRDARGNLVAAQGPLGSVISVLPVSAGGSALLTVEYAMINGVPTLDPSKATTRFERLDEDGNRLGATELDASAALVAVATTGEALVVSGSGGRWFGRDAKPLTGWFPLTSRGPAAALADGSVAVSVDGRWTFVITPGGTTASPAPEWLAGRSTESRVFVVRGGRANAFLGPRYVCPSAADVEIVSVAGKSCGTVHLPLDGCAWAYVGADGTAMAMSQDLTGCTWQWWRGALR